jgi:hypothetical protein
MCAGYCSVRGYYAIVVAAANRPSHNKLAELRWTPAAFFVCIVETARIDPPGKRTFG